jgi:hypothetical protein
MNVKRIHYQGGLSKERFLENGGGRRKPTLLRVKALLGDESSSLPRTFGIVLENDPVVAKDVVKSRPLLVLVPGGKPELA